MRNMYKKIGALIITSLVILQAANFAAAKDCYEAEITDVAVSESGIVTSADVTINTAGNYKLYAAVYENGVLKGLDTADITSEGRVQFGKSVPFNKDRQELKCFVWTDKMKPAAKVYKYNDSGADATTAPTTSPTPTSTIDPNATPTPGDGIIHLMGDSINADGIENVMVDGTNVTITAAGEYTVEGTLNDGQIIVNSAVKTDIITINLDGVNVTSSTGNAFDGQKGKVTLVPTQNASTFTSTSSGDNTTAIYSKNDLTIKGDGTLNAISQNGNGIRCKNDIEIGVCDLTVNAANNGIKGDESVKITKKNNSVTVVSGGEGIKSGTDPSLDTATNTYTADGTIVINGGTINISAGEDGIKAVKNVTVSGGDITITKAQEGIQVSEIIYDTDGTTILGYVEGEIDINGGTLNVTCSEDGIQCGTGNVVITDGNITVNSQQDCIQGEYITNISGGTFDLTAYGGAPQTVLANNPEAENSCKGIKGGNLVYISGGTFNINTYDDAIHSNNTVRILDGSITAATGDDGVHGDSYLYISDNADINITKSYEGIEAAEIYISGGETRVVSSDDGANAAGDEPTDGAYDLETVSAASVELFAGPGGNWGGNSGPNWGGEDSSNYGYLEVSGGLLYIEAEGDGFDSNGSGLISGGTVLVNGPTSGGNGVFDIGDNSGDTLTITGGTVIGAGTSDMAVTPTTANNSQYYVVTSGSMGGGRPGQSSSSGFSTQSAGKAFKLTDAGGNEIVTYVPSKSYSWVFVSTPDMTSGSYTLSYGGSVTGGDWIGNYANTYGIVKGGTYSGSNTATLTATK